MPSYLLKIIGKLYKYEHISSQFIDLIWIVPLQLACVFVLKMNVLRELWVTKSPLVNSLKEILILQRYYLGSLNHAHIWRVSPSVKYECDIQYIASVLTPLWKTQENKEMNGIRFVPPSVNQLHYNEGIMSAMASQITSLTIVYSTVYSGAYQINIKVPRHSPFWGEFTGDRWIPRTNSQ